MSDELEVLPCKVLIEGGISFGKGVKVSTLMDTLKRRASLPGIYSKMDGTIDRDRDRMLNYLALRWAAPDKAAFDAECAVARQAYTADFTNRVLRGQPDPADEIHVTHTPANPLHGKGTL